MTPQSKSFDDPARWRKRAEEAHREAKQMDDPATKSVLIEIAAGYEWLAAVIETQPAPKCA
jgi:hypothetical protein